MTLDVKNFYINTPMTRYEYVRIKIDDVPEEIIVEYNLRDKIASDGHVYVEIRKGMYGLPQAGRLAQEKLIKVLYDNGYYMCKNTTCLFKHKVLATEFTLTVDDFAISHKPSELAHLLDALRTVYPITYVTNTSTIDYVGFTAEFNYDIPVRTCKLSMPGYIPAACERFGIHPKTNTQRQPNS